MKISKIVYAVMALSIMSCAKVHTVTTGEPKEIAFRDVASAHTKATDLIDIHETMGIMACFYDTGDMYFGNTKFTYDTDDEVWTGNKYWPLGGRSLNFGAYAPYSDDIVAEFGYTGEDISTMYFTLYAPLSIDVDFLASAGISVNQIYDSENPVPLTLHHLLAKATVKIIAGDDDYSGLYEVTEVKFTNVSHKGTFDLDTRYVDKAAGIYDLTDKGDVVLLSAPKVITATDDEDDDATIGSTLIIPTDTGIGISVTYQYKDVPNSAYTKPISIYGEGDDEDDQRNVFHQDRHMVYVLKLFANKIEFSASVIDFDSETVDGLSN